MTRCELNRFQGTAAALSSRDCELLVWTGALLNTERPALPSKQLQSCRCRAILIKHSAEKSISDRNIRFQLPFRKKRSKISTNKFEQRTFYSNKALFCSAQKIRVWHHVDGTPLSAPRLLGVPTSVCKARKPGRFIRSRPSSSDTSGSARAVPPPSSAHSYRSE